MDNIKRIQIVFALDDPYQLQQYQYAYNRKNSSGYMKSLIQRDMESKTVARSPILASEPVAGQDQVFVRREEEESELFDFSIGGFI